MPAIRCVKTSDGLRPSEVVAQFSDYYGKTHYLRVERDFLDFQDGNPLLPVCIVRRSPCEIVSLVELPSESETGANRVWVFDSDLAD